MVLCAERLHQRLLRMAQARTLKTRPRGQDADRENLYHPRTVARYLRCATHPRGAACGRHTRRPQTGGPPDARGGPARREPAQGRRYHDPKRERVARKRPGEARLRGERPDELWVADITYVPTASGFLYLSVVVDAFSRAVVGWKMASHLRTELVLSAMEMALGQRRPDEVIHHSDRGSQYTSIAFGKRCERVGVRPSTGSSCYDNALCESFFATLECELLERERFASHAEARMAIFTFIEG